MALDRIEIVHGNRKAVFVKSKEGWAPEWFRQGERKMLRFKDHEWLSIGHVHPTHARTGKGLPGGGAIFSGISKYGKTPVAWSLTITPDDQSEGFMVDCAMTPRASIELLEAYSTFETPYEYDGAETVTTVIGMNPVVRWKGDQRVSPPIWENPAWIYSRPQSARMTGPCSTPYLCQAITAAAGVGDRFVTLIGDWNICQVHDVYMNPTRDVARDPESVFKRKDSLKGYKYIVGALNWSSAFAKDPNVLYAGGETYRQRIIVDFSEKMPGATFDEMLLRAWERTALLDIPADGKVKAYGRAIGNGASWQAAVKWLRNVFAGNRYVEDLYKPGAGICTYSKGGRPKAGGGYDWYWWTQWAGPLHYRAILTGDKQLGAACDKIDRQFADHAAKMDYFSNIAASISTIPTVHWIAGGGKGGILHKCMKPLLESTLARSVAENVGGREMDYGTQASLAEALVLGSGAYSNPAMMDQARVLLGEMDAKLDENFWEFNCGKRGALHHGGQIRSMGHGHAVMANLLAARATGDGRFLVQAHRFARYLLAVSYASHNGSQDGDFDWRGWCNGSNAGRDQIAEFPPWETQNGLLCLCAFMADEPLEGGFYDVLWYIARTGLAQFPAARSVKRVLDEHMQVHFVPRKKIASERDFYDVLPYLAYENPHDQTLPASYQGSDCILGEFVYGGGLAEASDPRLGVLSPRAALMDLRELDQRVIHVWNPTRKDLSAVITARWLKGKPSQETVTVPARQAVKLVLER